MSNDPSVRDLVSKLRILARDLESGRPHARILSLTIVASDGVFSTTTKTVAGCSGSDCAIGLYALERARDELKALTKGFAGPTVSLQTDAHPSDTQHHTPRPPSCHANEAAKRDATPSPKTTHTPQIPRPRHRGNALRTHIACLLMLRLDTRPSQASDTLRSRGYGQR